ncbi:MAG: hypothetical protein LAO09_05060, partial [Acidobacteriia bacterium]|nr:hypothetical protein [Terriglobia bacterium]
MIRPTVLFVAIIAVAVPAFCQQPQSLDLVSRIRYQRAIEEVYWQHRIWPEQNPSAKPALDAVISPEQLDARAEDALRLSTALQQYWHQSITGQQLQQEIFRLIRDSKQPEVLAELFAALGGNAHVVAEVLARPLLAERLVRNAYQSGHRFSAKQQPFEVWWSKVRTNFPAETVEPVFAYYVPAMKNVPAAESWSPTQMLPEGTLSMSAVWTGSEMIVWGGFNSIGGKFNTGSRYNPATDTWQATNNSSAPNGKMQHTAVWTGTEMIIWGGCNANFSEHQCESQDGGRYNPISDSWIPTALANAPDARLLHQAVWTGKEMIVWGGCAFIRDACSAQHLGNSGGRFNPSANSWVQINPADAPEARTNHTAVWNGKQMMIWGGYNDHNALNSGASYNPSADSWTPISSVPASAARFQHTAVWTGKEMLIWGGTNFTTYFKNGGAYNPVTKHWRVLSGAGAPSARAVHTAVWTGSEMIVWGGINGTNLLNTGGRYNPTTNAWKATT